MSELTRDEFEGWMKLLREDVQGVHTRLDLLNGRTRENERDIAVRTDELMRVGCIVTGCGIRLTGCAFQNTVYRIQI